MTDVELHTRELWVASQFCRSHLASLRRAGAKHLHRIASSGASKRIRTIAQDRLRRFFREEAERISAA